LIIRSPVLAGIEIVLSPDTAGVSTVISPEVDPCSLNVAIEYPYPV
jgi:hypothetical protein